MSVVSESQLIDPAIDTLSEVFEQASRRFGDEDALVSQTASVSFREWWSHAGGVASEFSRRGIEAGDIVVVILPSSIEYAVCYAAAVKLGAITSGVNPRMGTREVRSIIEMLDPKVIICDDESMRLVPESARNLVIKAEVLPGFYSGESPTGVAASPEDPVCIVWTSGTTGSLKGAWFDHRALRAVAALTGDLTRPYDRRLLPLPFAHAGFMTKIWETTAYGNATVLVPARWSAEDMLETLRVQRISMASAVPTQWERLLKLSPVRLKGLSDLRVATVSTAPASPELIKAMRETLGVAVMVRYASTETAMGTGTHIGDADEVVSRTVGRPHDGVDLRLVDGYGHEVERGEVGAVQLRSKAQMRGYWNSPELTKETITVDGWVRTGDIGYLRQDGNLVLAGRRTEMYIRGGYNIYPLEVENVLALHPLVREAAVVGLPAPDIGEQGVAIVVPADPSSPPTLGELREFVKEYISDYKRPDALVLADLIPRTAMMKIDRTELAQLAREALARQAAK